MTKTKRAIGIVRVSRIAGRDGESFASPEDQRGRIEAVADRERLKLIQLAGQTDELNVSGCTPLKDRKHLSAAIEAIEDGKAEVLIVAYLDRLCRSVAVTEEVLSRVEGAGGTVMTVDTLLPSVERSKTSPGVKPKLSVHSRTLRPTKSGLISLNYRQSLGVFPEDDGTARETVQCRSH